MSKRLGIFPMSSLRTTALARDCLASRQDFGGGEFETSGKKIVEGIANERKLCSTRAMDITHFVACHLQ